MPEEHQSFLQKAGKPLLPRMSDNAQRQKRHKSQICSTFIGQLELDHMTAPSRTSIYTHTIQKLGREK